VFFVKDAGSWTRETLKPSSNNHVAGAGVADLRQRINAIPAEASSPCSAEPRRDETVRDLDLPHRSDESLYVEITKTT
jgi:hypothetical protein